MKNIVGLGEDIGAPPRSTNTLSVVIDLIYLDYVGKYISVTDAQLVCLKSN